MNLEGECSRNSDYFYFLLGVFEILFFVDNKLFWMSTCDTLFVLFIGLALLVDVPRDKNITGMYT